MTLTAEQRAMRKTGIGASEIAAVAGLDPYKSAMDVYLEKIGLVEGFAGNANTEAGTWLEPAIIGRYAEVTSVGAIEKPGTIPHPMESFLFATPDALIVRPDERHGLEAKNRNIRQVHRWGESGTDQVPDDVAAQCHLSMLVSGLTRWDVACLLGGNDFRVYELRFDEGIAVALLDLARRFWQEHVIPQAPPDLDDPESAKAFVKAAFRTHDARMLTATPRQDTLALEVHEARRVAKDAEAEKELVEARMKAEIGDAAGIEGDLWKVTWKAPKPTRKTDWEALAKRLGASAADIEAHTTEKENSRRFLFTMGGE